MAPRLSVIVPFRERSASLSQALAAIERQLGPDDELLAVPDGDGSGPAVTRNAGARQAHAPLIVFVDSDVVVAPGALERLASRFVERPEVSAIFGAYDEAPADPGFVSQYKNLAHSFVHQSSGGTVATFWAGFGAVRREAFFAVGGFDERFTRPSVEDIDLGYRLTRAGYEIRLDPSLQAKHLKRWTLASMIVSDVRDRGIPWTRLLLRYGAPRDGLNLRAEYRISVVVAYVAAVSLVVAAFDRRFFAVTAAALAALAALNRRYYAFFYTRRGAWFAVRAFALHTLHHLCNGVSYAVGALNTPRTSAGSPPDRSSAPRRA